MKDIAKTINNGETALGIELGSTRIKAALIDDGHIILAEGGYPWENRFVNGLWTYDLDEVWKGVQSCYAELKKNVKQKYGATLKKIGAIGISGMMHGYLVFDKAGKLLAPFRTWRNVSAAPAAEELTKLFGYKIPARWSIAHLYQAIKDKEPHVKDIVFQTALEGYVHWKLTGEKVIGIGEASGMFAVEPGNLRYDRKLTELFKTAVKPFGFKQEISDIFPKILRAGEPAGKLTAEGAKLLDPDGDLQPGISFCPPEGDAGTGMVSTSSIRKRTCSVSAGTSIFGMAVLDKKPSKAHPELDIVNTPSGEWVAMAHCNNCSSEINSWANVFGEFAELINADKGLIDSGRTGTKINQNELYDKLFTAALSGDPACGGLLVYNYLSAEHITGIEEGRPLFVRTTGSDFNISNFMRAQLYSAFATLRIGFDVLFEKERARIDNINAQGGIFKTKGVAQRFLAAALKTPVTVSETAGGGGPWGMAVLARYMLDGGGTSLEDYLDKKVFANAVKETVKPDPADVEGFGKFMEKYVAGLSIVKEAVRAL